MGFAFEPENCSCGMPEKHSPTEGFRPHRIQDDSFKGKSIIRGGYLEWGENEWCTCPGEVIREIEESG